MTSTEDGANEDGAKPAIERKKVETGGAADSISEDDPHKVEKLSKLGSDRDPDEGSE